MPIIRVVKVTFDTVLSMDEVPLLRGAIVSMVGRDRVAFHNHLGDQKYQYSYPLIQYQVHGKNAGLTYVQAGTEEAHHFFSNNLGQVRIGNRECRLYVENVKINRFQVSVKDTFHEYRIRNWLPLNEKNFPKYNGLVGVSEKIEFLEKVLIGNILSFAKGVEWTVDKQISLKILDLQGIKPIKRKGSQLLSFDLTFRSNVFLPSGIGLGKSVSVGYGMISNVNKNI